MKNQWVAIVTLLLGLLLVSNAVLVAQDNRVPGGDEKMPLGVEQRNGKLVFESKDGTFQWWFDSRLQIDGAVFFENKNPLSTEPFFEGSPSQ